MTKITYIPGEIANAAIDEHGNRKPVTRTHNIFDDNKNKNQADINSDVDNSLNQLSNEIDAVNKQDVITVDTLPDVSTANPKKIYRVVGDNNYTDYMVNASGNDWKKLATYNFPGIDDEPIAGSDNLVKSGGVSNKISELNSKVGYGKVEKNVAMPFSVDLSANTDICIRVYNEESEIVNIGVKLQRGDINITEYLYKTVTANSYAEWEYDETLVAQSDSFRIASSGNQHVSVDIASFETIDSNRIKFIDGDIPANALADDVKKTASVQFYTRDGNYPIIKSKGTSLYFKSSGTGTWAGRAGVNLNYESNTALANAIGVTLVDIYANDGGYIELKDNMVFVFDCSSQKPAIKSRNDVKITDIKLLSCLGGNISGINTDIFGSAYIQNELKNIKKNTILYYIERGVYLDNTGEKKSNSSTFITDKILCQKGDIITWNPQSEDITIYLIEFDANGNVVDNWGNYQPSRDIEIGKKGDTAYIAASFFLSNIDDAKIIKNKEVVWAYNDISFVNEEISANSNKILSINKKIYGQKNYIENKKYVGNYLQDDKNCIITTAIPCKEGDIVTYNAITADTSIYIVEFNGDTPIDSWANKTATRTFTAGSKGSITHIVATFYKKDKVNASVKINSEIVWTLTEDGLQAQIDNIYTNVDNDILTIAKSKIVEIDNIKSNSDFSCLLISDVHKNEAGVDRTIKLANSLGNNYVNCVINGGDTVNAFMTEGLSWYDDIVAKSNIDVLNTVGNHDAWTDYWVNGTKIDVYNLITKKIKENIPNIVQPSNASSLGLNYYYNDYNEKIRIIVVDIMFWDDIQLSWFAQSLDNARVNGLSVIAVAHAPFEHSLSLWRYNDIGTFVNANCSPFFSIDSTIHPDKYENIIVIPAQACAAVKTFIDNGGDFVMWLSGHQHYDYVQYLTDIDTYGHQFCFSTACEKTTGGIRDCHRESGKYSEDAINYIGIDLTNHIIKVLRIGIDTDFMLREKKYFSYDYKNGKMIMTK